MNTGFLGPAVATVLTVYGIETLWGISYETTISVLLQQYLPFTVLKHTKFTFGILFFCLVATVLTVYGIETYMLKFYYLVELLQQYLPFTVLKH